MDNRNKQILYSKNDGAPTLVTDIPDSVYDMKWNHYDGKCYYICNSNLYRVGTQKGTNELVAEGVIYFEYSFDTPQSIKICGEDSKTFYMVGDKVFEEKTD